MRLIPLHRKELIKKLKNLWFKWPLSWGKHDYLVNKDNFKIIIPNTHSWKDIPVPILNAIIRQLNITREDFLKL